MPLALIVFATVLAHAGFNGSRLTISLSALALGASPLVVGSMMSLFAALPMVLGVPVGRLVDRIGVRTPILGASALLTLAVALPGVSPGVASLYVAAACVGTTFMMFHICVQHAVGEGSSDEDRKTNFGWLALGFSISNFFGPTIAGGLVAACGGLLGGLGIRWVIRPEVRLVIDRDGIVPDPRTPSERIQWLDLKGAHYAAIETRTGSWPAPKISTKIIALELVDPQGFYARLDPDKPKWLGYDSGVRPGHFAIEYENLETDPSRLMYVIGEACLAVSALSATGPPISFAMHALAKLYCGAVLKFGKSLGPQKSHTACTRPD